MTDFTWITSFPKSGNTWCRYIVAHLLFDFDPDVSRIDATIPDINNWTGSLTCEYRGAYPVKAHLVYDRLPKRMGFRNAVYIVRNPLDVIVSTARYMEPDGDQAAVDRVVEDFIRLDGTLDSWLELGFGTICENVMSWVAARDAGQPVMLVRYEDLMSDPVGSIRLIADHLGVEVDEERCRLIAEATSFDAMRSLEERQVGEGRQDMFFVERGFKKERNFRFMRAGKSEQFRETLNPDQIDTLAALCRPIMERFSYEC